MIFKIVRYSNFSIIYMCFVLSWIMIFYRFSTRSCPLCRLRNELPFSEREQTFEHLIMLGELNMTGYLINLLYHLLSFSAVINLIITILTFLVLIVVYHNYGKGLRDQCESYLIAMHIMSCTFSHESRSPA